VFCKKVGEEEVLTGITSKYSIVALSRSIFRIPILLTESPEEGNKIEVRFYTLIIAAYFKNGSRRLVAKLVLKQTWTC